MQQPSRHLLKVFDPNTVTTYKDNAHAFYYGGFQPPPLSDLPLRNERETPPVRESLIDLDMALDGIHLTADMETIKPKARSGGIAAMSHRKTLEWTFPTSDTRSENTSLSMLKPRSEDTSIPTAPPPPPPGAPATGWDNRASFASLIDLDDGLVTKQPERPSTACSDHSASTDGDSNAFSLDEDKHMTDMNSMSPVLIIREPSIYVADQHWSPGFQQSKQYSTETDSNQDYPPLPAPPSAEVMGGTASPDEVKNELRRLLSSFKNHLDLASGSTGMP